MADLKYYYVVSYDFVEKHSNVREQFLELLRNNYVIEMIGESAYGIKNDKELMAMRSEMQNHLDDAYAACEIDSREGDNIFLLFNSIKADYKVKDPESHCIYCYKIN